MAWDSSLVRKLCTTQSWFAAPFGVPKVSNSSPLSAIRRSGLEDEFRDGADDVILDSAGGGSFLEMLCGTILTNCRAVCCRRRKGVGNISATKNTTIHLYMIFMKLHPSGEVSSRIVRPTDLLRNVVYQCLDLDRRGALLRCEGELGSEVIAYRPENGERIRRSVRRTY